MQCDDTDTFRVRFLLVLLSTFVWACAATVFTYLGVTGVVPGTLGIVVGLLASLAGYLLGARLGYAVFLRIAFGLDVKTAT